MKCPNCKSSVDVRQVSSINVCYKCNLAFTGEENMNEVCEALGHDYTGNPNSCASGGTCVRCGHFEQCG